MENKWTQKELSEAFDSVVNKEDWKAPICDLVAGGVQLEKVIEGITFYTGTIPIIKPSLTAGSFIVMSEGYRMGPAGDH